ncbi:sll1863 family stress response protein [Undibacterium crateris]|uniref:hypothetical protein n=1 Tax=Undibacterium crateris TaxID=2528175 RepID=UPI00138A2E16|nr:hypothetical protein [Undibacterium crateris]NDI84269.1 hypothetical protein [Undibacterium crateris]
MKRRDEYILKMQENLDKLNTMLNEFEDKTGDRANKAQARFMEEKNKLKAQAKQINEKLNDMRVATEASWEQMVDSTEVLHHALIASLHYFKAELKSDKSTKEEK